MISKILVFIGNNLICCLLVMGVLLGIGVKDVQAACYSSGQHTCSTCCSRVQTIYSDQCICGPTVPTVAPTKVPTKAPTAIPTSVDAGIVDCKSPAVCAAVSNDVAAGYNGCTGANPVNLGKCYYTGGFGTRQTGVCCSKSTTALPTVAPTSVPQKTCNWWGNIMQPNTTNCFNSWLQLNGSDRVTCNGSTGNTTNVHFSNLNCAESTTTPVPTQSPGYGSCTNSGYSCNGTISRFCNGSNMMWEPTAEVDCGTLGCNSATGMCNKAVDKCVDTNSGLYYKFNIPDGCNCFLSGNCSSGVCFNGKCAPKTENRCDDTTSEGYCVGKTSGDSCTRLTVSGKCEFWNSTNKQGCFCSVPKPTATVAPTVAPGSGNQCRAAGGYCLSYTSNATLTCNTGNQSQMDCSSFVVNYPGGSVQQPGGCCLPKLTATSTPRPTAPADPRGGNNQLCLSNETCNPGFTPSFQTGTCVCHPITAPTVTVTVKPIPTSAPCSIESITSCGYVPGCRWNAIQTKCEPICANENVNSCGFIPGCKWNSGIQKCENYTPAPSPTGIFVKFFCDTVTHQCLSGRATGENTLADCEKKCNLPISSPTPTGCNQSVIGRCGAAGNCSLSAQRCVMSSVTQKFECQYDSTCSNSPTATATTKPGGGAPQATATDVPPTNEPSMCTECPREFRCYKNGSEYRWFVDGYVMQGFAIVNGVEATTCGNVVKPIFLGKSKGDATCDGYVNVADYALWHKEFYDGDAGSVKSDSWHADFTGTNGVCDGKVDINDYSLWHKNFYELMGNN